jgi:hypothetical protein
VDETYSPVPELNLLKAFQDEAGFEAYAEGFGLTDYNDTSGLAAGWSKEPKFLDRLVPFAQANGTGSMYVLWRLDDREDLATLPVVVFGDEGGQHVVARNLRELFQLLGYDSEIYVDWDDAFYSRDDEDEYRPAHDDYVAWLDSTLGLTPADEPSAIVAAAQAEFGERFATWTRTFLPD